jgi:two-component system sensor histidine kinase ChvG
MALEQDERSSRRAAWVSPAGPERAFSSLRGAGRALAKGRIALRAVASPVQRLAEHVRRRTTPVRVALGSIWADRIKPWLEVQPIWRWCTKTIGRRILVANLFGFFILFGGLMWLSQTNRWMTDAKVESLKTQARLIAVAIASNAKVETGGLTLDPDRLPDASGTAPTFADGFRAIELSIAPERVAPILGRLIQIGDVRARIYGRDGFLIVDSAQMLTRGQLSGRATREAQPAAAEPNEKLRSAWTRFIAWVSRTNLPVYRDIGSDRGTIYPEVASALEGKTTRMLLINAAGDQIVAVAAPITHLGAVQGVVQLSSRPGEMDALQWRQQRDFIWLSLPALLSSLLAAWMLYRTIAGPMRRLSESADQVTRNINAERSLPEFPNRRDEVAQLAAAFREMTSSLYRRIEAGDRFAQDVAHELKNPVAAARSTAEALIYAKTEEQRTVLIGQIQHEMKRLNRLITDVAKASRLDAELALQETEPLDLAELTKGIVDTLADIHRDSGRRITIDLASGPPGGPTYRVAGHELRLGQVMTNLIDNALSFSPQDGVVAVRVRRVGAEVEVTVDDDGPGIPPDRLDHVFRRFYSDRPQSDRVQGKNSGLGLSISREIVRAHSGRIHAENRPAERVSDAHDHLQPELKERCMDGIAGARFVVALPALTASPPRRP